MEHRIKRPEYFTDAEGRRLVRLPVNGSDSPAIADAQLFDNAARRHGLTGVLYLNDDGKGHSYVMATIPGSGTHSVLARLLLSPPPGYRVRYRDGNPLNLLPENLRLHAPWADEATAATAMSILLEQARAELPAEASA